VLVAWGFTEDGERALVAVMRQREFASDARNRLQSDRDDCGQGSRRHFPSSHARIEQHLPNATPSAADPAERELLSRYVAVFEDADMDGLVALLREDALLRMPRQALSGGLRIARLFLDTVAHGDLTRMRHRPTRANGRPAVTIELRAEDGTGSRTGSPCSRSRTVRSPGSTRSSTQRCCRGSESRGTPGATLRRGVGPELRGVSCQRQQPSTTQK
jgi:hypothetical protein